jgi:hypothetical protein
MLLEQGGATNASELSASHLIMGLPEAMVPHVAELPLFLE